MKAMFKVFLVGFLMAVSFSGFSQDFSKIKLDPDKEKKFQPYLEIRHGGAQAFQQWKTENKYEYIKQMWYFSESFYVKRNYNNTGVTLNEEIIDIARFEKERKQNVETIVTLPGYKDVLVLKAAKDCFYIHSN